MSGNNMQTDSKENRKRNRRRHRRSRMANHVDAKELKRKVDVLELAYEKARQEVEVAKRTMNELRQMADEAHRQYESKTGDVRRCKRCKSTISWGEPFADFIDGSIMCDWCYSLMLGES